MSKPTKPGPTIACRLCLQDYAIEDLRTTIVCGPRQSNVLAVVASTALLCPSCVTRARVATELEQGKFAEQIETNLNHLKANRQKHWGVDDNGDLVEIDSPNPQEEVH